SQLKMVADSATILENNIPLQPVSFKVSNSISTEYQTLTEKFKEINSSFTEQSKQFKKVQQKLKHQKLINKMLDERINKCVDDNAECTKLQENLNEKYVELKEEVTSEFYAASRFMAYLQTKCESLSQEFKESKAMCKEEDLT
ncbi:reticulocyte-binding protein 2 a-like isoform X3, partial [Biomphalaria glabrata]